MEKESIRDFLKSVIKQHGHADEVWLNKFISNENTEKKFDNFSKELYREFESWILKQKSSDQKNRLAVDGVLVRRNPGSDKVEEKNASGAVSADAPVRSEVIPVKGEYVSNRKELKNSIHKKCSLPMSPEKGVELCDRTVRVQEQKRVTDASKKEEPIKKEIPSRSKIEKTSPMLGEKKAQTSHVPPKQPVVPIKPDVRFRIANGKNGTHYDHCVEVNAKQQAIHVLKVDGLEECGLAFDEATKRITGDVEKDGTFSLSIHFSVEADKIVWESALNFYVAPDPQSLWKDIPSDKSVDYGKEDTDCKGLELGDGYGMAAASRRGRSHAHEGIPRDDDFCLHETTTMGWHVLAVSDGAGSAKFSREGSRIAVERSTDLLTARLDENNALLESAFVKYNSDQSSESSNKLKNEIYRCIKDPIYESFKGIYEEAESKNAKFRDYYATLLIGAHKVIDGRHCIFGYWRGDGAIAHHLPEQSLKLLGVPDGGEYAGQTRFLDEEAVSQKDIHKRIVFDSFDEFGALLLMTDGISDPKFDSDDDLSSLSAWDQFWVQDLEPILSDNKSAKDNAEAILEWMNFWSKGNHDDRTLAVLYCNTSSKINSAESQKSHIEQEVS